MTVELLGEPVTVGHVFAFLAGAGTVRLVRWWRRSIAWQHSTDGGAEGRRLRAEEAARLSPAPSTGVDE